MKLRFCLLGFALLLGACFQDSTPQHSDFLPFTYSDGFPIVRDCRLAAAHQNSYLLVRANSVAGDPYNSAYPLPMGSVVVGEEHGDPSCSSLIGYYLMAKESAGYYSAGGDWHWQRLDSNQRVIQDGKLSTCASCHASCASTDDLCSPP